MVENEKEMRQPSGPNRREWWQVKATRRGKSRGRKGASPSQIGTNNSAGTRASKPMRSDPKRAETQERNSATAYPEARTRLTAPVREAGAKGPERRGSGSGRGVEEDGSRSRRTGSRPTEGTKAAGRRGRRGGAPVLVPRPAPPVPTNSMGAEGASHMQAETRAIHPEVSSFFVCHDLKGKDFNLSKANIKTANQVVLRCNVGHIAQTLPEIQRECHMALVRLGRAFRPSMEWDWGKHGFET